MVTRTITVEVLLATLKLSKAARAWYCKACRGPWRLATGWDLMHTQGLREKRKYKPSILFYFSWILRPATTLGFLIEEEIDGNSPPRGGSRSKNNEKGIDTGRQHLLMLYL